MSNKQRMAWEREGFLFFYLDGLDPILGLLVDIQELSFFLSLS